MNELHRLALHQIFVLDLKAAPQRPVSDIKAAAEHLAAQLAPGDAARLLGDLALDRAGDWQADTHVSLVRGAHFYPLPRQDPLRATLLAYQDGEAVLIHLIWYWPAAGEPATFARLWACRWSGPPADTPGYLGQGLLLVAARPGPPGPGAGGDDGKKLAAACLKECEQQPGHLTPVSLDGGELYAGLHSPLRRHDWPAVLLFADPAIEQGPSADRWALDEWPLVVKYSLLVERLYLDQYRGRVMRELAAAGRQIEWGLGATFASSSAPLGEHVAPTAVPSVLASADPHVVEAALRRLSGPQHALLVALADGERLALAAQRDLRNLEDHLRRLPALDATAQAALPASEAVFSVADRARHWANQIEVGVAEGRQQAERTARAVDVLSTQAQALGATHERLLNWILAVVGMALAAAQIFDQASAQVIYEWGAWLTGGPADQEPTDADLFWVRLVAIMLAGFAAWVLFGLYLRLHRR